MFSKTSVLIGFTHGSVREFSHGSMKDFSEWAKGFSAIFVHETPKSKYIIIEYMHPISHITWNVC